MGASGVAGSEGGVVYSSQELEKVLSPNTLPTHKNTRYLR